MSTTISAEHASICDDSDVRLLLILRTFVKRSDKEFACFGTRDSYAAPKCEDCGPDGLLFVGVIALLAGPISHTSSVAAQ